MHIYQVFGGDNLCVGMLDGYLMCFLQPASWTDTRPLGGENLWWSASNTPSLWAMRIYGDHITHTRPLGGENI